MRIEVHSKAVDSLKLDVTEIYEVYNVFNGVSGGVYRIYFQSFEGYYTVARKDVSSEAEIKQCDSIYEKVREGLLKHGYMSLVQHEYTSLVNEGYDNLLSDWNIYTINTRT